VTRPEKRSARGFTLLEALVALAVFTALLVSFNSGLTGSWRAVAAAEIDSRAQTVASTVIEEAGIIAPFEAGERSGVTPDGYAYAVVVAPHRMPDARESDPPRAYWVRVSVTAPSRFGFTNRRPVVLSTLKRVLVR
jgi:prepilin-type N-terminal cleavage/methylation domain-containing protein